MTDTSRKGAIKYMYDDEYDSFMLHYQHTIDGQARGEAFVQSAKDADPPNPALIKQLEKELAKQNRIAAKANKTKAIIIRMGPYPK